MSIARFRQMKTSQRSFDAVALALLFLIPGGKNQAAELPHRAAGLLQAFDYGAVTLTGGPLGAQAQSARDFYLALPEDDLLNGFRQRAGLPAPGKPLGGWYNPEGFAGAHCFGQWISALARMYAETGDVRFKDKVTRLVHGFHETIGADGFFFSSQKVFREWPCYLYDKDCIGMRDALTLAGDEEARLVLNVMTAWAIKNLPRRSDEWYTLPENCYNCFALTQDTNYLEMARTYDYSKEYYDAFARGLNAFTPERHAYSHINTLCSAAKAYEVTGDEKYFEAISKAVALLKTTQMYASGGWGPNERFVTAGQGALAASLYETNSDWQNSRHDYVKHFETPCGSYANVNLDRYLLRFTGDAAYGDNMERVLYNGILAALPMQPNGQTFYYSDYHPGARKQYFPEAWPCCAGTYAQITADYALDVYFHDAGNLYVNLFTPSQVRWQHEGIALMVEQATAFPQSDATSFIFHTGRPVRFGFNVRVPGWATKPVSVRVNGKLVKIQSHPATFLQLDRTWREGDKVTVTLPMSMRFEAIDAQTPNLAALMFGPMLFVALADGDVRLHGERNQPENWMRIEKGSPLKIAARNGGTHFVPFYLIRNERYTTYCYVQ